MKSANLIVSILLTSSANHGGKHGPLISGRVIGLHGVQKGLSIVPTNTVGSEAHQYLNLLSVCQSVTDMT